MVESFLPRRAASRAPGALIVALGAASLAGCPMTPGGDDGGITGEDAAVVRCAQDASGEAAAPAVAAPLSAGRVLRRVNLALRRRPTNDVESAALAAATTDADRNRVIEAAIDEGLRSTDFYNTMIDFGHEWMRNGRFVVGAQGDGYWGNMSTHLGVCPAMTAHAGAWYILGESNTRGRNACNDQDAMGMPAPAPTRMVQPWWDPSTTVTLVGDAALEVASVTDAMGRSMDCGIAGEGYFNMNNPPGCGCGPNAAWCFPGSGLNPDQPGRSQKRDIWEEPARMVAHLAWHDRSLSDLVLGNYTVANNRVRAWYLRFGRQTGLYNARLDGNTTWFRPEMGDAPRDPLHMTPADPEAWRELVVEELAPQLMSLSNGARSADPARTFRWDPRTETGPAPGLPAAGVFTMPGTNSTFSRERPRAARFLEIFACREFNPPPPDQHFPEVGADLARTGPCMHCHTLMDPVAIAFRRWIFVGYYVQRSYLADLGNLEVPNDLYAPARRYPYGDWFRAGAERWKLNWLAGTTMTPTTEAELTRNMGALFMDTIPPEYTIFGQHTDGTMGPLAFAKVLVSSGEFDRCAVRRIYERFVGRALDPGAEARYIDALAQRFVTGGRQVRPFVRSLLTSDEFRRGL
ncbi:MAG: hypothetical protein U0269_02085 [Polyangiales bacterium]